MSLLFEESNCLMLREMVTSGFHLLGFQQASQLGGRLPEGNSDILMQIFWDEYLNELQKIFWNFVEGFFGEKLVSFVNIKQVPGT